jgi:hypothetical protein
LLDVDILSLVFHARAPYQVLVFLTTKTPASSIFLNVLLDSLAAYSTYAILGRHRRGDNPIVVLTKRPELLAAYDWTTLSLVSLLCSSIYALPPFYCGKASLSKASLSKYWAWEIRDLTLPSLIVGLLPLGYAARQFLFSRHAFGVAGPEFQEFSVPGKFSSSPSKSPSIPRGNEAVQRRRLELLKRASILLLFTFAVTFFQTSESLADSSREDAGTWAALWTTTTFVVIVTVTWVRWPIFDHGSVFREAS